MKKQRILKLLKETNAEAILLKSEINRNWLTGYRSSYGLMIVGLSKTFFITDMRYFTAATNYYRDFDKTIEVISVSGKSGFSQNELLEKIKSELNINRLLVEQKHVNLLEYKNFLKVFDNILPIESAKLREIKTSDELELLQKAADIAVKVMHYVWTVIKPGMTENEVKKIIKIKFIEFGADGLSFEPIVAAGLNGANPHHSGSDYVIQNGDMVTIDIGCMYKGFASDMTRTVLIGSKPSNPEMEDIYKLVKESQELGVKHASTNISGIDLDLICKRHIDESKYKGLFIHGTGHGVGMEVHELPNVNTLNKEKFVIDNVITIEPGIYKPGVGGVRIEDTIVIKKDKIINLQAKCSKELQLIKN